jgi:multiple sugar transport system permease protein
MIKVFTPLYALLTGAIWSILTGITIAVTLALLTGLAIKPVLWAFLLTGIVGAAWIGLRPIIERDQRHRLITIAVHAIGVLLFALFQPFTLSFGESTVWQLLALIGFAVVQSWMMQNILAKLDRNSIKRRNLELSFITSMRYFGFLFFGVMVLLPLYVLVMSSLKSQQALLMNPLDLMPDFSQSMPDLFRSYIELFTKFNFDVYLWNAALVSVLTVIITLAFAIPGAYAVSRLNFPGRVVLSRSILMIYLVPAIVLVIPLYAVFSQLGLRNSLTGLLLVYPATTLPVALYMLQGYFRGLPRELEEAGMMDGCSRLRVILTITLPLSLPAMASVALYVFMIAWNEFLFAFMFLDDPQKFTLSRGVVSLNSSEVPRQHLMAGAVIATAPILVIFLWAERFLVQGLTAGSVKG